MQNKSDSQSFEGFTLVNEPTKHQQILLDACKEYLRQNAYKTWSRFDDVAKNIIAFIEKNQYSDTPILSDAIAAGILLELTKMLVKENSTLFKSLIEKNVPAAIAAYPPKTLDIIKKTLGDNLAFNHFNGSYADEYAHNITMSLLENQDLTTQQISSLLKNVKLELFNQMQDYPPEEKLVADCMLKTRNWLCITNYIETLRKPSLRQPLIEMLKRSDYDPEVLAEIADYLKNKSPDDSEAFLKILLGVDIAEGKLCLEENHLPPFLLKHNEFYSQLGKLDFGNIDPLYIGRIQRVVSSAEKYHRAKTNSGLLVPSENELNVAKEIKMKFADFVQQCIDKDLNEENSSPSPKK